MAQPPKKLKGKLLEGFEKTKLHASSDGPFTLVQCSSPISPLAAKPWAFGQFRLPSRIFSSIMYTYAYFNVLQYNYFIYWMCVDLPCAAVTAFLPALRVLLGFWGR